MRTLILEDEMLIGLELEEEMRARGHEVCLVSTLAEAEAVIGEGEVDFAILDANIQGQVPAALAEELRRRGVPFVYVSGYDEKFIREHLPEAPFLPKPVSPPALDALIEKCTDSRG